MIHSLEFPECCQALVYVYRQLDMDKIESIIDKTPMLNETQRHFYKHMLRARYTKILEASYQRLKE